MRLRRLGITIALILYFCSTLWLSFGVPFVFTSPDENANFTFARVFHEQGIAAITDDLAGEMYGQLHPRSVVAVGDQLLPGSFLGLPLLAGMLASIAGDVGALLLTPLLLLAALLAWYDLIRRSFADSRLALLSTILFAVHPAVWYYASRSMMHNVGFVCWLVIAAWVAIAAPLSRQFAGQSSRRARVVEGVVSGICVGVALTFRLSEALWVGALVAAYLMALQVSWRQKLARAALIGLGCALPLLGLMYVNTSLYGGPFTTGYTVKDTAVTVSSSVDAIAESGTPNVLFAALFPFGIHERSIARNVWNFGVALFPLFSLFAGVGIILSLRAKNAPQWRQLAVVTLALAVWLAVVYGSWSFNDNPDPTAITIGDSHVRYWLPLFVLSTIFAARAALFAIDRSTHRVAKAATIFVLLAMMGSSAYTVMSGADGLLRTREVLFVGAEKRAAILAMTEPQAIVVVDRADKFLWPYRRVLQPLRDDGTYAVLPTAAAHAPLYYFGIPLPEKDIAYLNDEKLAALGLRIDVVAIIVDEALYRISSR